jgi:DNA-binding winged helix-turn-helix (wHTH) protein
MASEFSRQHAESLENSDCGISERDCAAVVPKARPGEQSSERYLQVGPFTLDLETRELSRAGLKAKLQNKVYEALLVLLERPGEIVTRDELCKRLWPEDSQVNYEANVNTTVNKLRQVLGDSRTTPQFIETIPRRGYSLIANVAVVPVAAPQHIDHRDVVTSRSNLQKLPDDTAGGGLRPRRSLLAKIASFANAIPARWLVASVLALVLAGFLLGVAIVLFEHSAAPKPTSANRPVTSRPSECFGADKMHSC